MALGLAYLHGLTPGIVHGDLKGANVLVTQSRRACLADFGLATAIDSNTIAMTHKSTVRTGGTVRWQAPELFDPSVYQQNSKASDIYALACVYYEVRCQITIAETAWTDHISVIFRSSALS